MTTSVHFFLNDQEIVDDVPAGMLVLDYLRNERRHVGTKEGCREGDCGACVVLIGELHRGRISYQAVTSCLMPVGELHGKHLVTIEGLNMDQLSPVQQAVVDLGASQCGFCTPGIIVSLTGYLVERREAISRDAITSALGGHLCRCTGYRSLKDATEILSQTVGDISGVGPLVEKGVIPEYFKSIPGKLAAISSRNGTLPSSGDAVTVAGGTDIYVQQGDLVAESKALVLNAHPGLKEIERTSDRLNIGALVSFEQFANHPDVIAILPRIKDYMAEIASVQIRNRATIGGNIINASPIGDMTILMLALLVDLELSSDAGVRSIPISEFYTGYKSLNKSNDEILSRILIPLPGENTRVHWEKVSKRKYLDIASVNSAAVITCNDRMIQHASIAVGGVAPVPLLLKETNAFLENKLVSDPVIGEAIDIAQSEIKPIDDVRGSATYKRLLTRQFIISHFATLYPEFVSAEVLV